MWKNIFSKHCFPRHHQNRIFKLFDWSQLCVPKFMQVGTQIHIFVQWKCMFIKNVQRERLENSIQYLVSLEGILCSSGCSRSSSVAYSSVREHSLWEFFLCSLKTGTCSAENGMHPLHQNQRQDWAQCEEGCHHHHNDWHSNVFRNPTQSCNPTTDAPFGDSHCLDDVKNNLAEKHKEEEKKIEWTVRPESLVNWPVPADESTRSVE